MASVHPGKTRAVTNPRHAGFGGCARNRQSIGRNDSINNLELSLAIA